LKYIKSSLMSLSIIFLLLTSCVTWAKDITIATFSLESLQVDSAIAIMTPIYKRIGYDMKILRFPGKRSVVEADKGTIQGELLRVKTIENDYPNLIRIPYAIGYLNVIAITCHEQPEITELSSIVNQRVGILRGVEVFDALTKNLKREVVNNIDSLFGILFSGRVDVILFPELDAQQYIKSYGIAEKVNIGRKAILKMPLYHFVHKDASNVADKLMQVMKPMQESGELDRLIEKTESAYD